MEADELAFLDIEATKNNRLISLEFVEKVGEEANMPFAVGGGIRTIDDIRKILERGAEKVILNSAACVNPAFIKAAANTFGSSTIVVCIDVKANIFGKYFCVYKNSLKKLNQNPTAFAKKVENLGAGEIIIQSVDRDGTYRGYDLDLIRQVSTAVTIPVVALGGARSSEDFLLPVDQAYASAVAAGSIFVYHGPRKAVLINYPTRIKGIDAKQ